MTYIRTPSAVALVRFGLNSANALRLVEFYERAFGAQVKRRDRLDEKDFSRWTHVHGGAERTTLILGDATLEMLQFDHPGRPYPEVLPPYDTRFQHFGIVVADMQRAVERLAPAVGWAAISTEGPQTLPPSAGGVTAFKFRDPEGHPLEFLQFPPEKIPLHWKSDKAVGIVKGMDHSALSVRNIEQSIKFYQSLGLHLSARALNQGVEQQRLDGVPNPLVDVVAFAPSIPTPHIELLHYRMFPRPTSEKLAINDTAAARLTLSEFEEGGDRQARGQLIQDPDGHFLEVLNGEHG